MNSQSIIYKTMSYQTMPYKLNQRGIYRRGETDRMPTTNSKPQIWIQLRIFQIRYEQILVSYISKFEYMEMDTKSMNSDIVHFKFEDLETNTKSINLDIVHFMQILNL